MALSYEAIRISENVYWVGALDWGVRNFHGYLTSRGTTYNAFLVLGEEVTLVDTVKEPFLPEMLARIRSVIDPRRVDYIISNHAELDHSGSLPGAIEALEPKKVFASKMGVRALEAHFHSGYEFTAVADGQQLRLGDRTFSFVETKMCHWPDSMVAYLHEDQVLFSQDGFGMHLCTSERFDDEVDRYLLEHEAAKYYANILLPMSNFIQKALARLGELALPVQILAPDHGPLWRKDIAWILDLYAKWSRQKPTDLVLVIYDTMWHSTERMAQAIGDGLHAGGVRVRLLPLEGTHRSDIATHLLEAGAVAIGSPTLNKNVFPTVMDCMTYLKGLARQNLLGAAFGSYGWSGEAAKDLHALLGEMGVETVADPINVKYVPDEDDLQKCRQLGLDLAARLKERLAPQP